MDLSGIQTSYVRVVNVEQPVETHVDTERHIDQVLVLLLQAVVNRCQAIDDVRDGQQLIVVGELVLLEGVLGHVEVQQVHCGWRARRRGDEGMSRVGQTKQKTDKERERERSGRK